MSVADTRTFESLLVDNLPLIDKVVACLTRRHALSREMSEDFASFAKLRLVENDYAVLRKFRAESTLATYLTVVLAMLFREYRVQQWGRWRPSAAAVRRGPLAVRLETLVHRDGYRFQEALQIIRSSGATSETDRELGELFAALPNRAPIRPMEVPIDQLNAATHGSHAEHLTDAYEYNLERVASEEALRRALVTLKPEDALILRMRFWEGMAVADIARALCLRQKALYPRIERLLAKMRRSLEADGISPERARIVLAQSEHF